jgi:hypothetical protein
MVKQLIGLFILCFCSFSVWAGKTDMVCLDKQTACMQPCIAKGDMACAERCAAEGQKCLDDESAAQYPESAKSQSAKSGNSNTNLQGCWRAASKMTTWCFNGTTSTITTDSYAGAAGGKRITELDRVSLSGSSMTYYIVRAIQTGPDAYDRPANKGPYTQAYTYSDTRTPSFFAAGDQYEKQ